VAGGSHRYIAAVARRIPDVRTSTAVHGLRRFSDHVEIRDEAGVATRYSAVVTAVHPDQALGLLEDPTPAERDVLGAIPYVRNKVVLHTDGSVLPRDEDTRGAWNFDQPSCSSTGGHPPAVHYYLNRVQRIRSDREYVVTLQTCAGLRDVPG
jgi:predicted NAD/FAD-binding protein